MTDDKNNMRLVMRDVLPHIRFTNMTSEVRRLPLFVHCRRLDSSRAVRRKLPTRLDPATSCRKSSFCRFVRCQQSYFRLLNACILIAPQLYVWMGSKLPEDERLPIPWNTKPRMVCAFGFLASRVVGVDAWRACRRRLAACGAWTPLTRAPRSSSNLVS
jgi:hypothetical protein